MKYRILKDELKRNTRRCAVFGHWRHNSLVKPEKRLFGQSVVDNFVYKSWLKYSNTLAEMQSSPSAQIPQEFGIVFGGFESFSNKMHALHKSYSSSGKENEMKELCFTSLHYSSASFLFSFGSASEA